MKKTLYNILIFLLISFYLVTLTSCFPPKDKEPNPPVNEKPDNNGDNENKPPKEEQKPPVNQEEPPAEELPPKDKDEDEEPKIEPLPVPDKEKPPELEPLPNEAEAKIKFIDEVIKIAREEPTVAVNKKGKTKYGEFFGNSKGKWDTTFILWCVNQAEINLKTHYIGELYPWKQKPSECVLWFLSRDKFIDPTDKENKYTPQKGDLLFFDYNLNGIADHTALVTKTAVEKKIPYIFTIEGQIPQDKPANKIRERKIKFTNKYIYGYGTVY